MKLTKVRYGILPAFLALLVAAVGVGTVFAKSSPPPGHQATTTSGKSATTAKATSNPARQMHMQKAINSLQTAESELNAAQADKGGHRNKAISDVQDAISQTKAGMQAAQ